MRFTSLRNLLTILFLDAIRELYEELYDEMMGHVLPEPIVVGDHTLRYEEAEEGQLRCLYCHQPMSHREGPAPADRVNHHRPPNQLTIGRTVPAFFLGLYDRRHRVLVSMRTGRVRLVSSPDPRYLARRSVWAAKR